MLQVDGGDASLSRVRRSGREPDGPGDGRHSTPAGSGSTDDYIMSPPGRHPGGTPFHQRHYAGKLYTGSRPLSTRQGAVHCGSDKGDVKGIVSRGVLLD